MLFGMLYFRGLYHNTKKANRKLWYDNFSARQIYRAAMSLNRYEWLMRTIAFLDQSTVRADSLDNRIVHMRWFLMQILPS